LFWSLIAWIMAKRTIQPEAAVPAEPRKARASTSRTAAAAHKHTAKKVAEASAEEVMTARPNASYEEIARLAYSYWAARGYQGGSPEADWFRAERALLELA
jgi:hypothetical protein